MAKISKRYIKEGETIAFKIGNKIVAMKDVIKLLNMGKIENANLMELDNKQYVKVTEPMPVGFYNPEVRLDIIKKLEHDGKQIGFMAKDKSGKEYKLTTEKIWLLGTSGMINNIIAGITVNGQKVIKNNGIDLDTLESVEVTA